METTQLTIIIVIIVLVIVFLCAVRKRSNCDDSIGIYSSKCCPKRKHTDLSLEQLRLELLEDCYVASSEEVYEMYNRATMRENNPALRDVTEMPIDTFTVAGSITGTDPDPGAPIYGYDPGNVLDVTGDSVKSYNPAEVATFKLKYHGDDSYTFANSTNAKAAYDKIISYAFKRGLPFPIPDLEPGYEGWLASENYSDDFDYITAFRFVFDGSTPTHLDIISNTERKYPLGMVDEFVLPDAMEINRLYPVRVPIVTTLEEYKSMIDYSIPVVYYDESMQKITINYPPNPKCAPAIIAEWFRTLPEADIYEHAKYYFGEFRGTFLITRRSGGNTFVSATPTGVENFTQASAELIRTTRFVEFDESETIVSDEVTAKTGTIFGTNGYEGMVLSEMSRGSDSFDFMTIETGDVNAFVANSQIFENIADGGDNVTTVPEEFFAIPTITFFLETESWSLPLNYLPAGTFEDFATGAIFPEDMGAVGPSTPATPVQVLSSIQLHEFIHNSHASNGSLYYISTEGIATAFESDQRYSKDLWTGVRPSSWIIAIILSGRGAYPATSPDEVIPGGTYGQSLFFLFFCHEYGSTGFDPNYQVLRRWADISALETIIPYLDSEDYATIASNTDGEFLNMTGRNLDLAQAMDELHSKDLRDVYTDYAISMTMLRNNTSIPPAYRTHRPYCLASSAYPGSSTLNPPSLPPFLATMFDYVQTNKLTGFTVFGVSTVFPEITGADAPGFGLLPFEDMNMIIFDIEHATVDEVTVFVSAGDWRLAMVQFTSDGTPAGVFMMDGVHSVTGPGFATFDVTAFDPLPGNPLLNGRIRLVCVHVSLNDYGSVLDNFRTVPGTPYGTPLTGVISIGVTAI